MGYMRHDMVIERIRNLGEQPLTGLKPVFGEPIRCFISNGLFLGCVVDGVVADIWGPRSSLARLGTPIYDLASTQWHIWNYHLSHMPPEWRHDATICLDQSDVVFLVPRLGADVDAG